MDSHSIHRIGQGPSMQIWKRNSEERHNVLFHIPVMILTILIFNQVSPVISQKNECSCTPLEYKWILNFTNPCLSSEITVGSNTGIEDIFCSIDVDSNQLGRVSAYDNSEISDAVDGTPVMISSYLLVELNDGNILDEKNITLIDGNIIKFVSDTTERPALVSKGFLAEIIGKNAADEKVELSILIHFTNICRTLPFQEGDRIGWLTYGEDTQFRDKTCFPESNNPSGTPSVEPSRLRNDLSVVPSVEPSRISIEPSATPSFETNLVSIEPSSATPLFEPSCLKSSKKSKKLDSLKSSKSQKNTKAQKSCKKSNKQNDIKDQKTPKGKGQTSIG